MHPSRLFATLFTSAVLAAPISAQETPSDTLLTVDHFMDLERVGGPQISPDGLQIVYTRSRVDIMADQWDSDLWLMNADGSRARFLTKGSDPRWSPDGTRIAYVASEEPGGGGSGGGTQIFVRWMDAEGATSQITHVTETPTSMKWSPDGSRIAFIMLVPDKETWQIDMPAPPTGAEWTETPRLVTRRHFRQDRVGFLKE